MKNFKVHVRKYCGDYETAYLPFLVNKTSGLRSTQLTSSKVSILQSYQALFANQPSLKAAFDWTIPAAVKILRDMTKRKLVKMFMSVVLEVKSANQMLNGHSHTDRVTLRTKTTGTILQMDDHEQLLSELGEIILREAEEFTQGQSGMTITNVRAINLELAQFDGLQV